MRRKLLIENLFGVSLMYDTVFFIVMVSLAGAILLPVLRTNIADESSIDKHREELVDEALQTFLVTRLDSFEYRFCGNLIDDLAAHIGIDNSSDGLYGSLTRWMLAHEQLHKTYATLLSEYLGCQFMLPFQVIGTNQLNVFVGDFERHLRNETERFFSSNLGKKYHFNFTAWWHPLRAVPFGGEFCVGERPPTTDCFVAQSSFMMPYTPVISIGNRTMLFTKQWLKHQFFNTDIGFGESSIPMIANITRILENYTGNHPPYDTRECAVQATAQNLSHLIYGFFVEGIVNETNVTVFPGIIHTTLLYGFEKVKNISTHFFKEGFDECFGESIRSIDRMFYGLNSSALNLLSQAILGQLNLTLQQMVNGSFVTLNDAFEACEQVLDERVRALLTGYLDSLVEVFVNHLYDIIDILVNFSDILIDWLFDNISLNRAEAMLSIWVVRE